MSPASLRRKFCRHRRQNSPCYCSRRRHRTIPARDGSGRRTQVKGTCPPGGQVPSGRPRDVAVLFIAGRRPHGRRASTARYARWEPPAVRPAGALPVHGDVPSPSERDQGSWSPGPFYCARRVLPPLAAELSPSPREFCRRWRQNLRPLARLLTGARAALEGRPALRFVGSLVRGTASRYPGVTEAAGSAGDAGRTFALHSLASSHEPGRPCRAVRLSCSSARSARSAFGGPRGAPVVTVRTHPRAHVFLLLEQARPPAGPRRLMHGVRMRAACRGQLHACIGDMRYACHRRLHATSVRE